jgi:hypothetical protein
LAVSWLVSQGSRDGRFRQLSDTRLRQSTVQQNAGQRLLDFMHNGGGRETGLQFLLQLAALLLGDRCLALLGFVQFGLDQFAIADVNDVHVKPVGR